MGYYSNIIVIGYNGLFILIGENGLVVVLGDTKPLKVDNRLLIVK